MNQQQKYEAAMIEILDACPLTEQPSGENQTDTFSKEELLDTEELAKQKSLPGYLALDKDKAEQGLAKLVLTVIELIRRLMEKQAMARVDKGSLTDEELEELGITLMKLEEKMQELKKAFNLEDEELNLNLGPLGNLM